ncbi:predicted protein [Lichtheimia corymbifera JMRC:FSU:9682]|uniref:OTU domain-containing protein n=1 Tax=Lichtheimia corymbifera JMRC:FSU:9682 TaxID=1263082 RepID=A0A068SI78_9FUNG|nr:predicted protein [Lichtheimia corymbifera JMRC:FSU:9682]
MLATLYANTEVYKKYILFNSDEEYRRLIEAMEYGLAEDTKMVRYSFCPRKYWFDASTMAQIAADAFGRPVAVFETGNKHSSPPRFLLPLTTPSQNAKPSPMILHLVGNHYYSLVMKPSLRVEWPPVPLYHRQAWDEMQLSAHCKTTWRYLHIKKSKPKQTYYPDVL